MSNATIAKRAANAAYAARFPRRDKAQRRHSRTLRTEQREKAWLEAMGIERDGSVPLVRSKAKAKRKR